MSIWDIGVYRGDIIGMKQGTVVEVSKEGAKDGQELVGILDVSKVKIGSGLEKEIDKS